MLDGECGMRSELLKEYVGPSTDTLDPSSLVIPAAH